MKRVSFVVLAVALLSTFGCRAAPASRTVQPTPRVVTGDPVGDAYQLLVQRSVGPINPSTIAKAGVQGLRVALMTDGVLPPIVPTPTFGTDATQDQSMLDTAIFQTASRYGSKLNLAQADDAVIASMAESINDCHTAYFTPPQFTLQQQWIQGQVQFGGIGASLRKTKPTEPLVIWRVFTGSPAEKAGLKDGDVIRSVDGRDVSTFGVQSVVDLIRGPVGQPVNLTIQSGGNSTNRSVTIVRAQIQPPNVESRMLPNQIGYVQLYGFPENVAGAFRSALDSLDRQGARAWILDLRDNGGGSLDAVTQVASMFVPRGALMYYLYDSSSHRTDYLANGSVRSRLPPTVVLVNDGTGSGGEIFAAVLREQGIARIVGQTTAGCVGTGQLFPLPGGAGLQVTVAQLLTGRGKVLNKIGVSPDVDVSMTYQDLMAGHDPQVQRAVSFLQTGA